MTYADAQRDPLMVTGLDSAIDRRDALSCGAVSHRGGAELWRLSE